MSETPAADRRREAQPRSLLDCVRAHPPDRRLLRHWTAGVLTERVETTAVALRREGVAGEVVGLRQPNGDDWTISMLALLAAGAVPLLVAPDTPDPELERVLGSCGGSRWLAADPGRDGLAGGPAPARAGEPPSPARAPGAAVLLPTSGSTGQPVVVARTQPSLLAEAARYRDGLGVGEQDRLLLPLPLSHAYGLGWLVAGLLTGAQVLAIPPTALGAAAEALAEGATVVALVPATARLLTRRLSGRPAPAPRMAMVGAGAVDSRLDADVEAALGLRAARNYGSTETGAVLAGTPPLPPRCVGTPLPGVEVRVVDSDGVPCADRAAGSLELRLDAGGEWRGTGDLAEIDAAGRVTILGRRSGAVRRGSRWVAPLEVEDVLRQHPRVRDVHVRAATGRHEEGRPGIEPGTRGLKGVVGQRTALPA